MNRSDRDLGMDRPISRRDILHGFGAITAGAVLPDTLFAGQLRATQNTGRSVTIFQKPKFERLLFPKAVVQTATKMMS